MKFRLFLIVILFLSQILITHAVDGVYTHNQMQYTPNGLNIYGISGKDFVKLGYTEQVKFIKNRIDGTTYKYVLGSTGDYIGSEKGDLFTGFDNYRTNTLRGGQGDDYYEIQHTYTIVENPGEGIDTYFTQGNTGPGKTGIENFISAGGGGRIYGNDDDNLFITEGKSSELHGGGGNDIFLANGTQESFYGEDGVDTIIFPGLLADYTIIGDPWSVTVSNIKTGAKFHLGHHDIEQLQFDDAFFGYEAGSNVLSVGPNRTFKKVSDALHVAGNDDILEVDSGVYEDDFAIINRNITIRGKGGRAHFVAKSSSFAGKANFITYNANVTFENVEFSGNHVSDRNGAGIRYEGGILTVRNSYFHHNEVGILGGNYSTGIVRIEDSEFAFNGISTTNAHTVNLGEIAELSISRTYFQNTTNAHNVRSLARNLTVTDSFFADGVSDTSFNIEVAKADNVKVLRNTFVQEEQGPNTQMILNTASVSSEISGNIFINHSSRGINPILNQSTIPVLLENNKQFNFKGFVTGASTGNSNSNTILSTGVVTFPTPMISVGNVSYPTPETPQIIPNDGSEFQSMATRDQFTGKVLTVGSGKMYSTLKSAIEAASSGDTILIDEGVYVSDYATISNKNIAIIGLGNGATLKKSLSIPNGKAIIVSYQSNVLFENIIFTDSEVPDKNGAGIRYEGGTLTISNCTFRNNENGILGGATPVGKGKIWITNSKFIDNGKNGIGYTHAIYIGEMDEFTIMDSIVTGTSVGHHLKSRARKTTVLRSTFDDLGKDASYNIDLPNGGEALIRDVIVRQSVNSPNRTLISYSAEKNPPNPGALTIENTVFESEGSVAVGVKNHGTNRVILRNNTYKNITTKYIGSNITEEGSGATSTSSSTSSSSTTSQTSTSSTVTSQSSSTTNSTSSTVSNRSQNQSSTQTGGIKTSTGNVITNTSSKRVIPQGTKTITQKKNSQNNPTKKNQVAQQSNKTQLKTITKESVQNTLKKRGYTKSQIQSLIKHTEFMITTYEKKKKKGNFSRGDDKEYKNSIAILSALKELQ